MHAALNHLLTQDDRFELVFSSSSCEEFLHCVAESPVDVGVIGWVIGPCDGRFILDHLNGQDNPPRIVVYTGDESKMVPSQVMTHGGAAFVSKSEQPIVLLDTIAAVAAGRMVFPYIDVRSIYDNPLSTLTRREMEVLSDLASGRTNKQIARDLGVSLKQKPGHFHVPEILSPPVEVVFYLPE